MTAVKVFEVPDIPRSESTAKSRINWYPVLGACLAALAAALTYGGIYFALLAR